MAISAIPIIKIGLKGVIGFLFIVFGVAIVILPSIILEGLYNWKLLETISTFCKFSFPGPVFLSMTSMVGVAVETVIVLILAKTILVFPLLLSMFDITFEPVIIELFALTFCTEIVFGS